MVTVRIDLEMTDWSQIVRHCRQPPGRVVWRRFALVMTPAMLAVGFLVVGAFTGAVPVALALEGQQSLKIGARQFSAEATEKCVMG